MKVFNTRILIGLFIALASVGYESCAAPTTQQESKATDGQPPPAVKPQSIREGMGSVGEMALELKDIERHLQSLEESITGIDASFKPVVVELKVIEERLQSVEKSVAGIDTSVRPLGVQLKVIEERLQSVEKSIAGIDDSLKPVGALAKPEGLSGLIAEIGNMADMRARAFVLLATGCAAALIVLSAALRRWSNRSGKT